MICMKTSNFRGSVPIIAPLGSWRKSLCERGFRHFAFCGFSKELWAMQRREGFRAVVEKENFPSRFTSPLARLHCVPMGHWK